jgi:hypothetical protein
MYGPAVRRHVWRGSANTAQARNPDLGTFFTPRPLHRLPVQGTQSTKLNLRLPDDLREELAKAAEKSRRSLTAEILYRLDQSLAWEKEFLAADAERKK